MKYFLFILLFISSVSYGQFRHRARPVKSVGTSVVYQNLLLWSEDLSNAVWGKNNITVTTDQTNDVAGNLTADQIQDIAPFSNYIYQSVTVSPSTTYYLSFDVKRGTATDIYWGIHDNSNFNDLVTPVSYYSSTSGTITRLTFSFTTTASTTSIAIQPYYNTPVSGTCFIGRVQLATNSSYAYIQTTTTAYP